MLDRTRKRWEKQDRHTGDRQRLFAAVAAEVDGIERVLYPGSFVDLAPSFVWPSVTYLDLDRRAAQFFADEEGVDELLAANGVDPASRTVRFLPGDYTEPFELDGPIDLLVSLYAGFVSEHCTDHLRVGGTLLVNPSHGDAAMASIDPRYRLRAAVTSRSGRYSTTSSDLDRFLVPKRDVEITREALHESGRGVAYTTSPFAYLFERVA